ncbi:MAG: glycosyltransferase [Clostridia bacterium]|nr:glycosyltransferase [Clostridia bacterium]
MQTELPLISVIVPCYKVEQWLPACLDSLLAQTYRNLELICVDDGSPDRSGAILDDYAKKDPRIRVIHRENGGLSAARNSGLAVARGEYIGFVDSDDSVLPEMYETLYRLLLRYDADIADCAAVLDTDTGKEDQSGIALYRGGEAVFTASVLDQIATPVWSKLFKAALWKELRFPEGAYYEDCLTLPALCENDPVLVRTERKLYRYNRQSTSIMRGRKNTRHLRSRLAVFDAYLGYMSAHPSLTELAHYYVCCSVPSRSALVLKSDDVPPEEFRAYRSNLRALFLAHWQGAKRSSHFRSAPKSKRLLWTIYRFSPALAAFLAAHYSKKRTN